MKFCTQKEFRILNKYMMLKIYIFVILIWFNPMIYKYFLDAQLREKYLVRSEANKIVPK